MARGIPLPTLAGAVYRSIFQALLVFMMNSGILMDCSLMTSHWKGLQDCINQDEYLVILA